MHILLQNIPLYWNNRILADARNGGDVFPYCISISTCPLTVDYIIME